MVELIGELIAPIEFIMPVKPTASLPTAPNEGTVFYDSTTKKLVFWNGTAYQSVTSA